MENLANEQIIKEKNTNMNKLLSNSPGFVDELEGIVSNEPKKNKYETVKFHKLNKFPYFLIGKVVSKFDFDGVSKYLNGVGMLIGPDVVLTVAHNLCHLSNQNGKNKILLTKKVCYFAASNGDFNIFEPVKSAKIYVPPAYISSLKTDNKEEQLYNDWGLIFLSSNIGDQLIQLLDVEKSNNLKVVDKIYQFFATNQNFDLMKLSKQTKSDKVSIVGYTEYKDTYRNNSAYKFLNNFTKTGEKSPKKEKTSTNDLKGKSTINAINTINTINALNSLNLTSNQGKLISELVNENEDKQININININTGNESVTEGLINTSRYYHQMQKGITSDQQSRIAMNGVDYVVLNKEEYNKDFDVSDVDKLIMSESKGNLIGLDLQEEFDDHSLKQYLKAIKYQISTYKGQSGSPIFLRIKKISEKNKSTKNSYFYHFIGLHSRRGPIAGEACFYESEKMNALTENMMTNEVVDALDRELSKGQIRQKGIFDSNKSKLDLEKVKDINLNNDIVKQNGLCEYNIALSIIGEMIREKKETLQKEWVDSSPNVSIDKNNSETDTSIYSEYLCNSQIQNESLSSEFVLTKIYLNHTVQLSGLFKKSIPLSLLFSFGARIFNVPKEYILLKDLNNSEFSRIHNYNFDHSKKYSEILLESDNSTRCFELMLNIKKYGEFMSNNILQKFLENYDLEESKLKNDFEKKYMKPLFQDIFAEINSFENVQPTYGKLFKKIRKIILLKLGLL